MYPIPTPLSIKHYSTRFTNYIQHFSGTLMSVPSALT